MLEKNIERVLEFPEGNILITKTECHVGNGVYFMRPDDDVAYLSYQKKSGELLGKHHFQLETRSPDFKTYDVTYEVEDGQLLAARLISQFSRSAGTLADDATTQALNEKFKNGLLELKEKYTPPEIQCAAKLPSGDTLLVISGLKKEEWAKSLFIGDNGNFQEYTLGNGIQGGNRSCYTVVETGDALEYDYQGNAFGNHGVPFYGDSVLKYIDLDNYQDLEQFGLKVDEKDPHLDPFCPELAQP